jgi:hypothetical protein
MRSLTIALAASLICVMSAANAADMHWALAFEGSKSGTAFLTDERIVQLITIELGIVPDSAEMVAFNGVPQPVTVSEGRYVWSSSCEPHACPCNRGFFWLDVATGESLSALAQHTCARARDRAHDKLTIGGSQLSVSSASPEAISALRSWINLSGLRFDRVQYCVSAQPGNSVINLDPAGYSAPVAH